MTAVSVFVVQRVYALCPKSMGIEKFLYIILRYKVASFVRDCLSFYVVWHLLIISDLCERMQIFSKKVFRIFGWYAVKQYFCTRFRERNADEYWNTETKMRVTNLRWKNFFWKFLPKSFGGSEKVLTFASAFEKKAIKKSSLKDLDMNKQVVQDLLMKNE